MCYQVWVSTPFLTPISYIPIILLKTTLNPNHYPYTNPWNPKKLTSFRVMYINSSSELESLPIFTHFQKVKHYYDHHLSWALAETSPGSATASFAALQGRLLAYTPFFGTPLTRENIGPGWWVMKTKTGGYMMLYDVILCYSVILASLLDCQHPWESTRLITLGW